MKENILRMPLEEIMGERFGRYSKYIIQERALPDARDGLKPVQRRILFSMYKDGNTFSKAYRKSAKSVGNVMGNYHPHGDSSIYEAMVRMSQDWKYKIPLIEMHGNNGSIDGDPAAAMRYTEARLSKLAEEILRDIDKETVLMAPNFDDTAYEPTVLPARFPNLLVNGATGISSGYATNIPPHNLTEVIDATVKRIESPNCRLDTLMGIIKGPDFPTGATVQGKDGIRKAFESGSGKVMMRAKYEVKKDKKKQAIIIHEIPYEVNKATLVRKIDEIRIDKKVDGIIEVRDESDRDGLRIAIDIKKEASSELIVNYLLKNTDLQKSYSYNMVAIINKRPMQAGLLTLLDAYVNHQKEIILKRSEYDLRKAKERAHIVEGLMKALSILDEVIETIRNSNNKKDAKENLIKKFDFSEAQAEAIVMLQLYRLTNTDITALKEEEAVLKALISELTAIIKDETVLKSVLIKELKEIKKEYHIPRRSVIEEEIEDIVIDEMAMIPQEDVVVTVSKHGYLKRTTLRSHTASQQEYPKLKDEDYLLAMYEMSTHDTILVFTKLGNYLYIPIHELPDIKWGDMGMHLSQHIPIDPSDEIIYVHPVKDFNALEYITHFTSDGQMKKTVLKDFDISRYNKSYTAIKLKKNAFVKRVLVTDGSSNVMIVSNTGYAISFPEDQVNPIGVRAGGVKGINLKKGETLADAEIFHPVNDSLLLVTDKGNMKRIRANEFLANRANRGILAIKDIKSNPHEVVGLLNVDPNDSIQYYINNEIAEIVAKEIGYYDRTSIGKNVTNYEIQDVINKVVYLKVPEPSKVIKEKKKVKESSVKKEDKIIHQERDLTIDDFLDEL